MLANRQKRKAPLPLKAKRKTSARRSARKDTHLAGRFLTVLAFILLLVLVSTAFLEGYRFVTGCRYFAAADIEVDGACVLSADEVMQAAGVARGENILSINLGLVRRRLLAQPWIAKAEVYRVLPGKLKISIKEHTPVAIVDMGEKFYVQEDGKIFKRVEGNGPDTLPVITGLDCRDIDDKGYPASRAFKAAMNLLAMAGRMGNSMPGMKIRRISVDRDAGLTMFAFDHIGGIRLGFGGYADKLWRLGRVMDLVEKECENGRRVASIGLEWPGRVAVETEPAGAYAYNSKKGESCGSKT